MIIFLEFVHRCRKDTCVLAPEQTLVAFRADSAFTVEGEILASEGAVFRRPAVE